MVKLLWNYCKISGCLRQKVTVNESISFTDHASGIWLPDGCKLVINQQKDKDFTIVQHDIIIKFFWRCPVSLVKFSYWSKFHVNTWFWSYDNFVYKGLTRNVEIKNTSIWVLSNNWRLGRVRDDKFGTNFPIKCYLKT